MTFIESVKREVASFVRTLALAAVTFGTIGLVSYAVAQVPTLFLTSPIGTEQIDVIVPSTSSVTIAPQKVSLQLNVIRNTTGYQLSAATSGTVTTTLATNNLLLTAAAATLTVNVPPSPADGQLFTINNATGTNFSGTITVASTDSSTFVGLNATSITNLAASTGAEYTYTAPTKIWYRVR